MKKTSICCLLSIPFVGFLYGFTPFTAVVNVCPKCPISADELTLTSNLKVSCRVVAQNNEYYVISRHGEYRAVKKAEIAAVKWRGAGGPSSLGTGDQILLKNGAVFHGAILERKKGRYYVIQVGSLKHVIWNSQIKSVHKGGLPYTPAN